MQAYADCTHRDHPNSFKENLDTFDIEAQYGFRVGAPRGRLGGGYRYARDQVENSAAQAFMPADRNLQLGEAFVQDQIAVRDDVDLIVGAKVETNIYTDAEFLPNVRLAWRPTADQLVWAAASRAVRSPSRIDRDFFCPASRRSSSRATRFQSEVANVDELGYRAQFATAASLTVTVFATDYDRLRSLRRGRAVRSSPTTSRAPTRGSRPGARGACCRPGGSSPA